MFQRRTTGSVVCPSCGSLVGVRDDKCYSCGRANPGLWGFGPALRQLGADFGFVQLVIGACVTLFVFMLLMSGSRIGMSGFMSMLSPDWRVLIVFGASGAYPVFEMNRWWTVLSAGWLHASLLHIAMNMYWIWVMGPALVDLFGPARTVIIYTAGCVGGFVLSSVAGLVFAGVSIPLLSAGPVTVGASAPVFGLIGAMYHYGRTASSYAKQQAIQIIIQAVVFGLLVRGIDNYAHLGGFAGGYAMSAFLNPLTRERGDHMVIAIVCLAASLLSIVASVLTGLKYLS